MKNILLVTFMSLATAVALANEPKSVLDPEYIQYLPALQVLSVEVDHGPAMAAVQPSAFLKFAYTSCKAFSFTPRMEEKSGVLFVAVETDIHTMECRGPQMKRQYEVQISSDYRGRVVILNPVLTELK